ncbi:hypothetical protein HN415_02830 [Candidatus Woesearchaeota archaeon]|jgi:hypothetical protein|nr:hypothetical protein [Candidatus Woesearchaeota archaeon]
MGSNGAFLDINMNNIKIEKGKNEVKIKLNIDIYTKKVINQAILDYKSVADIKFDREMIIIAPKDKKDLDLIGFEFCNYLVGLKQ